ncbi:hypothetical protein ACEPAG_3339 [Sanghuangporus baumii]
MQLTVHAFEGLLYRLISPILLCKCKPPQVGLSSPWFETNLTYAQAAGARPEHVVSARVVDASSRCHHALRFYIHELRNISLRAGPPPFPGPPSNDGAPKKCTGRLFTDNGCGPFHSYREMSRWYQDRLFLMQKYRNEGLDSATFDDSAPLVFTHMDLHPRNIILGDDGQLWIIDWNDAGWYPSWFEAASMIGFAKSRSDIPSSWTTWIPFMAGSCERPGQLPFIRAIAYSL